MSILDFLHKKNDCFGCVLFRGNMPARLENFEFLKGMGIKLEQQKAGGDSVWVAQATHPQWGQAELLCPREVLKMPAELVKLDPRLNAEEVDAIVSCGNGVNVKMRQEDESVLSGRKKALRMMRAMMGDDGVAVHDFGSQRYWTRTALDEELAHDAPLDIESLFTFHAVTSGEGANATVTWLHTHGLAELGFFDFDILEPSPDVVGRSGDLMRAIALGIIEGWIEPESTSVSVAEPGGEIRMVKAATFQSFANERYRAIRDDPEGAHLENRSVVCEPAGGLFSRLFGTRLEPSRWLQKEMSDNIVIHFSTEATELMAQRARGSYSMCRRYSQEFAEFEVKTLVKLGLRIDGGAENEREHLWFDVKTLDEDKVTAVLLNAPWYIKALKEGETYTYGCDVMTDWAIFTPAGRITPVEGVAARMLRTRREEFLKIVREHGGAE